MADGTRARWGWPLLVGWCVGLTAFLYGDALRLPFFFDDFVHLPFVDAYSLPELWTTAGNLAYYRPLPFTLWKLQYLLLGYHSAPLQHLLNLLLHVAAGLLVAWLAGALWRDTPGRAWLRRGVAATLFLAFPFSYQAVPWIGSLAHLLVTFLVLAAVATYVAFAGGGGRGWALLSLGLALLAPFAHENGVLVAPLIFLIRLTEPRPPERPRWPRERADWLHPLLWAGPLLVWFPLWWFTPKGAEANFGVRAGETLLQNGIYFLQGLAFPLTALGGRLREVSGLSDLLAAGLLGGLALLGAALVQWRLGAGRRGWLPWLWYALAALPAVLFLSFDYVINGPRLLMLPAVGAAWLWADVTVLAAGRLAPATHLRTWLRPALVLLLVGLVVAGSAQFVRERMAVHGLLGTPFREATGAALAANAEGRPAVLVNLPSWITPGGRSAYAVGHEGVQFWPAYAPAGRLVSVPAGVPGEVVLAREDAVRPELPYYYGVSGDAPDWPALAAAGSAVYLADYGSEAIRLRPAGRLGVMPRDGTLAAFGPPGAVRLRAARVEPEGDGTRLTLTWEAAAPPEGPVTVFVHAMDGSGQLVAQADGDPLGGLFPLGRWPAGLVAEDVRYLPVAAESVTLRVGLYERASGERLPARDGSGELLPEGGVAVGR